MTWLDAYDGQSIADFDRDLSRNLYQIWNRMSSGSYFPPAVKAVPIPKKSGGERILGIPTVSDRIAQTVVTLTLEPILEPVFHEDSYGYRRGKSAHDAIAVTRKRCWQRDWVEPINPYTYLVDVLQRISQHPASQVADLTPRLWKTRFTDNPLRSLIDPRHADRLAGQPKGTLHAY